MADPQFYDTPMNDPGFKGRVRSALRRTLTTLLLPIFERQAQIHDAIRARLDAQDHGHFAIRSNVQNLTGTTNALNHKLDLINDKVDRVNEKADRLMARFEQLEARVEAKLAELHGVRAEVAAEVASLKEHGEETREELASVVALHWDHVALGRRLAQLEDRLIAADPKGNAAEDSAILFPGLERFSRPQAG